ncbi:MAG: hypothetical protein ACOY4I_06865 [Bacillota bacterium]
MKKFNIEAARAGEQGLGESFKGIIGLIEDLAKQIQNVASAADQISG